MSTLTKLLEYGFAGQNQQKRMLESYAFKQSLDGKQAFDHDGKELGDAYKYLLQTEAAAIAGLDKYILLSG